MLRRLIVAGLAAGLAAPILAITPASSAILVTCTAASGTATLTPGLGKNQTAQTDVDSDARSVASAGVTTATDGGDPWTPGLRRTPNPTTSFPPRPLGCPAVLGGVALSTPTRRPS